MRFLEKLNLSKMVVSAIIINSLQIVMMMGLIVWMIAVRDMAFSYSMLRYLLPVSAVVVIWGAVLDIREAFDAREAERESNALQEAYTQLEKLHYTTRAQRHDFMNHLQVVYSLIELDEHQEAAEYIDKVYGDIQKVGRAMKTASPAINALLMAKLADCDSKGIHMEVQIDSQWEDCPIQGWEMCRILGNLLDNAIHAAAEAAEPARITVALGEDVRGCRFSVENNGPEIPDEVKERIFETGFTTKARGQGMGLAIVRGLLHRYGGDISVVSQPGSTCFSGWLPKKG